MKSCMSTILHGHGVAVSSKFYTISIRVECSMIEALLLLLSSIGSIQLLVTDFPAECLKCKSGEIGNLRKE